MPARPVDQRTPRQHHEHDRADREHGCLARDADERRDRRGHDRAEREVDEHELQRERLGADQHQREEQPCRPAWKVAHVQSLPSCRTAPPGGAGLRELGQQAGGIGDTEQIRTRGQRALRVGERPDAALRLDDALR